MCKKLSLTLYPAHSRIGRGNLMLRHSVPQFLPNSTVRFASAPERKNRNISLSKYFISSSGDQIHYQSVLQSHFVPLRHDWPQSMCKQIYQLNLRISLGQIINGVAGCTMSRLQYKRRHLETLAHHAEPLIVAFHSRYYTHVSLVLIKVSVGLE